MDDSNWIAHSKEDLEEILDIADEFYSITKAAINKSKSQLLTNTITTSQTIPIKFGSSIIDIKPELGSIRFLGVWINECNKLSAPLRKLVKHNSSMTISSPDCLFKGSSFYNLNDLWTQQLKSFSTALLYQFNSKSLYKLISTIRLFQLQSQHSLHISPLCEWNKPFNTR